MDSIPDGLQSSSSVSASSWSLQSGNASEQLNSSRENLLSSSSAIHTSISKSGPIVSAEIRATDAQSDKQVIATLQNVISHLEEQVRKRDVEIDGLNGDRDRTTSNVNKSVQTENKSNVAEVAKSTTQPVSSTPFPKRLGNIMATVDDSTSVISPISNSIFGFDGEKDAKERRVTDFVCRTDQTAISSTGNVLQFSENVNVAGRSRPSAPADRYSALTVAEVLQNMTRKSLAASESEAWSEPDRNVSFARIGLANHEPVSQSAMLRKSRTHSVSAITANSPHCEFEDTSDDCDHQSKRAFVECLCVLLNDNVSCLISEDRRRSRSDAGDVSKAQNRLRFLEQENSSLRSQLADVMRSLRSTWDAHRVNDRVVDDSEVREESDLHAEDKSGCLAEGDSNISTAHYIIDALQNRLMKMKESAKRKEQRLRETKEIITKLEFKVKEKYFINCESESQLKETNEKLQQKKEIVNDLEQRLGDIEAQYKNDAHVWESALSEKDLVISELKQRIDATEKELRTTEEKYVSLEKSHDDAKNLMHQIESDSRVKQDLFMQTKSIMEDKVRLLEDQIQSLEKERRILQGTVDSLVIKVEAVEDIGQKYVDLLTERDDLTEQLRNFEKDRQQLCARCLSCDEKQSIAGITGSYSATNFVSDNLFGLIQVSGGGRLRAVELFFIHMYIILIPYRI